jgi:hypothetical protein
VLLWFDFMLIFTLTHHLILIIILYSHILKHVMDLHKNIKQIEVFHISLAARKMAH